MTQLQMKHWQDPVNAIIGAWLVVSPWILGYQGEGLAMTNGVIIGLALLATALGAIFVPRAWEEWTEVVLGVWMLISPWVLGFGGVQMAMWNAVISGLAIVALALWVLATDKDYAGWWGDRVAH